MRCPLFAHQVAHPGGFAVSAWHDGERDSKTNRRRRRVGTATGNGRSCTGRGGRPRALWALGARAPCRWPHNSQIDTDMNPARFRTVVVTSDNDRDEVVRRIEVALRGDDRWQVATLDVRPSPTTSEPLRSGLRNTDANSHIHTYVRAGLGRVTTSEAGAQSLPRSDASTPDPTATRQRSTSSRTRRHPGNRNRCGRRERGSRQPHRRPRSRGAMLRGPRCRRSARPSARTRTASRAPGRPPRR